MLCTYDPATRGGNAPDNRKVKATIHWVSAAHALTAEARLYDYLFTAEYPQEVAEGVDWKDTVNPASLEIVSEARVEPSLEGAAPGERFQFERLGYFFVDADRVRQSGFQSQRIPEGYLGENREKGDAAH